MPCPTCKCPYLTSQREARGARSYTSTASQATAWGHRTNTNKCSYVKCICMTCVCKYIYTVYIHSILKIIYYSDIKIGCCISLHRAWRCLKVLPVIKKCDVNCEPDSTKKKKHASSNCPVELMGNVKPFEWTFLACMLVMCLRWKWALKTNQALRSWHLRMSVGHSNALNSTLHNSSHH